MTGTSTNVTRPTPASGLLRAALVRRPHGVRGELRVEPLGGDASRFAPGLMLMREDTGAALRVRGARPAGGGDVLLELEGVDDRHTADGLRSAYLCVDAGSRRRLGEDEWFVFQLVGLRARDPHGADVGIVVDVEDYPEQQVLVISDQNAGLVRLPLVRAFVNRVDVDGGVIEVTPWPDDEEE